MPVKLLNPISVTSGEYSTMLSTLLVAMILYAAVKNIILEVLALRNRETPFICKSTFRHLVSGFRARIASPL